MWNSKMIQWNDELDGWTVKPELGQNDIEKQQVTAVFKYQLTRKQIDRVESDSERDLFLLLATGYQQLAVVMAQTH